MTTPAEKDAMALALLDAEIASCGRLEPEDCENCARIREARAHLAARVAELVAARLDARKALLHYGRHDHDCDYCHDTMFKPRPACTCGLDTAIDAARGAG